MKEIKINFNPKLSTQVGKVPDFKEKNASICHRLIVIPFDKNFTTFMLYGSEEQLRDADPVVIKRLCRGEPVKPTRELYELVELKLD